MFFAAAAVALAGCQTYGNDEFVRYLQRKDTVTLSAGDASQANAVAQTIHPWPRYVGNRNIPMEGSRGVRAMECYRQGGGQQLVSDKQGRAPNSKTSPVAAAPQPQAAGGANQLNCGQ